MCICRHNYEFIVSDMVGNLYGVDHDEMLWKVYIDFLSTC
jgi:hypothetical protein